MLWKILVVVLATFSVSDAYKQSEYFADGMTLRTPVANPIEKPPVKVIEKPEVLIEKIATKEEISFPAAPSYDGPRVDVLDNEESFKSMRYPEIVYPIDGETSQRESGYDGMDNIARLDLSPPATIVFPSEYAEYNTAVKGPSAPKFHEKTEFVDVFEHNFECPKLEKIVYVKVYPECTCQPVLVRPNMLSKTAAKGAKGSDATPVGGSASAESKEKLQDETLLLEKLQGDTPLLEKLLEEKRQDESKASYEDYGDEDGKQLLAKNFRNFKTFSFEDDDISIVKDRHEGNEGHYQYEGTEYESKGEYGGNGQYGGNGYVGNFIKNVKDGHHVSIGFGKDARSDKDDGSIKLVSAKEPEYGNAKYGKADY